VQPIKGTTAQTVADAFIAAWVSRFGVPAKVTTDRGPQFLSGVWACLCKTLGMKHLKTTSYHPQANGMVERLHRQIKESLRARESSTAWADHLPWIMLGLRAAPKDDAGISAAEAALGSKLVLPGPSAKVAADTVESDGPQLPIPSTVKSYAEALVGPPPNLDDAEWVMVAKEKLTGRPLAPAFTGPYLVLER